MAALGRLALAIAGTLIVLAGVIHLAMTGHLVGWFRDVSHGALPGTAYAAMTLNHVVVGVLLLPLGLALVALRGAASRGDLGARVVLVGAAFAVASLPVVVGFTATPEMLSAPAFAIALICLSAAAALTAAAVLATFIARPAVSR